MAMIINPTPALDFDDVLIVPKPGYASSRENVKLDRTFDIRGNEFTCIPIMASNMDHTGTLDVSVVMEANQCLTVLSKSETKRLLADSAYTGSDFTFVTFGLDSSIADIITLIERRSITKVCLDVANGYLANFLSFVRQIRVIKPNLVIMAGNIATVEGAEALSLAGADIVKIGIGPGSVCDTRKVTGCGYPQLQAILDIRAHLKSFYKAKFLICADGGCKTPGDVAKAFAAGADFVMLGGMLAGHTECSGELETLNNKPFKKFYGMASSYKLQQDSAHRTYRSSEGRAIYVPHRGNLDPTLKHILGGLRSACSYMGSDLLEGIYTKALFVRVNTPHSSMYSTAEDI